MLTYKITKTDDKINWTSVPAVLIDKVLWTDDTGIRAKGQVCHNGDSMFVHLSAHEDQIRAKIDTQFSPVYDDSCLEFFFKHENDKGYFNFEINPNGCIFAEYGPAGSDRKTVTVSDPKALFDIHTGCTEDGWEVFFTIPLGFIRSYAPGFVFSGKLMANMYKCGNKTAKRHFLSWSPIELERPDFHCPEFFGQMIFE